MYNILRKLNLNPKRQNRISNIRLDDLTNLLVESVKATIIKVPFRINLNEKILEDEEVGRTF